MAAKDRLCARASTPRTASATSHGHRSMKALSRPGRRSAATRRPSMSTNVQRFRRLKKSHSRQRRGRSGPRARWSGLTCPPPADQGAAVQVDFHTRPVHGEDAYQCRLRRPIESFANFSSPWGTKGVLAIRLDKAYAGFGWRPALAFSTVVIHGTPHDSRTHAPRVRRSNETLDRRLARPMVNKHGHCPAAVLGGRTGAMKFPGPTRQALLQTGLEVQPPWAFDICSNTWSTLKLEGFCRGGKSLNVATNCWTAA